MGKGTTRGGGFRGTSPKMFETFKCPLCGAFNTKRKSVFVRGARFCKHHTQIPRRMDIQNRIQRAQAREEVQC